MARFSKSLLAACLILVAVSLAAALPTKERACPTNPRGPGKYTATIRFDGGNRDYILYVPSTYPGFHSRGTPVPLFFVLHGFSNSIEETYVNMGVQKVTEENNGTIAVVPAGHLASWNGGACCPPATFLNKNDVGFIRELARIVAAEFCIDAGRIFAGGYSNGGFMSHRLGCQASDLISGIGPVAGHLSDESEFPCRPVKQMPVVHFHGTDDRTITYDKAPASWKRWASINTATNGPRVTYQREPLSANRTLQVALESPPFAPSKEAPTHGPDALTTEAVSLEVDPDAMVLHLTSTPPSTCGATS